MNWQVCRLFMLLLTSQPVLFLFVPHGLLLSTLRRLLLK